MSETAKRQRRARVALCAAITFDGKLDAADPFPAALLNAIKPDVGDEWLLDQATARLLPAEWARPARMPGPADMADLRQFFKPSPNSPPVRRWLCLGGPDLFHALLDAGRVSDLYLLVRPRIDGQRDSPTLGGPFTPEFFSPSIPCRLRRMEVMEGECFLHYTVARRPSRKPPPAIHDAP